MKYLDLNGLTYFWGKIKAELQKLQTAINGKAPISHTHIKSQITDFPTSMPANGGNADTVNGHTVEANVPSNAKFTDTVYTHPSTSGNKHIPSGGSSGQILRWASDGTATWGADNDTKYSVVSKTAAGLVPQLPNETTTTKYLRQDGTWQVPPDTKYILPKATASALGGLMIGYTANGKNYPVALDSTGKAYVSVPWTDTNTTYSTMTAATASAAGKAGLVPAPAAGAQAKFLRGDATWQSLGLSTFGVTASATELNYVKGVTGAIQTQLNGKAASSHTHTASQVTQDTTHRFVTDTEKNKWNAAEEKLKKAIFFK